MINLIKKFILCLFENNYDTLKIITYCYCLCKIQIFFSLCIRFKNLFYYISNLFNLNLLLDLSNLESLFLTNMSSAVEYLKIQELTFLAEYFLITALFCLILFALVSTMTVVDEKHFPIKFKYNNQLAFLLIFTLVCYLVLVYQQKNMSLLTLTSFNNTIYNDQLSFVSKLIVGISSILYLVFIIEYLQKQKLSNVEYYVILLIAIFGFFLLCGANDLITAYLAIELQGLAFYMLASFKKSSIFSMESGVKYFVLGSLSTALFLFGTTFLYALSGSLLLTDFKDFFIWVFSTNSALLTASSIKQNCLGFLSEQFLQISISVLSGNDFFIENTFQDVLVEFVYSMKNNQLDYESFIDFKSNLSEANYYKRLSVNQFYEFSLQAFNLKESSSFFFEINKNIDVDFCLNNIYNSLQCSYFSDCVFQILNFADFLQNNESVFEKKLSKAELTLKSYALPVINIVNLNNFFLESVELTSDGYDVIFNFDFAISGMLLIVLSLFFKLALAPFHFWAPDVYEGSPSSSTFFFMVISKLSIFVFLLRICYSSFYSLFPYWQFYSLIIATFSVFIGAIVGLKQRKLKSLLTYSSISNMGFVLLAFSVGNFEGVQAKFYYLIVYTLGSLSIWSIILNLKLKKKMCFEKQNKDLVNLVLLYESNNILAQNLGITLFSLAGLPPTVGFFAKIGVFKALIGGVSMYFLGLINILFSIVATFYYLRIIKIIFFENILVGNLYCITNSKKIFMINLLAFALFFLFTNPILLYLYSYKITLFLNKTFY